MPDSLRGKDCQDSGYRHGITHTVSVVTDHPITRGLPSSFEMTDELYLAEIFTDNVTPLLQSNYSFVEENFYSATKAVKEGKMFDNENWHHPAGSNLVGWSKHYGKSPLVYIQGGDDPVAYENPDYRQLLENAIRWVADPSNIL
jgi:type 1 glutamine amidotransferase